MIKALTQSGLSVIPVDADKKPRVLWKKYMTEIANDTAIQDWKPPIALVGGKVSGGLVCIDFDDKGSQFAEWMNIVCGLGRSVGSKVIIQLTPSGGYHVVFRTDKKIQNKKLAETKNRKCLIETRGEGGYFLISPSIGYELLQGEFTNVQKLSNSETDILIDSAKALNQRVVENNLPKEITSPLERLGKTPLDDFDDKNSPEQLLLANGWKTAYSSKGKIYFIRPGKKSGISASWNNVPDRFYVFSTSTEFEACHIYKASAVYAIFNHNGDFSATAKDLYKQGYGERVEQKIVDVDNGHKSTIVYVNDCRNAIYNFYKSSSRRGKSLGLNHFDDHLRLERGYLNVVTGIPTHGKSEFLDFISMRLATKHDWKFTVFSPENYPVEIHVDKLASKYADRSLWGVEKDVLDDAIDFIHNHFCFIDAVEEDLSLDLILDVTRKKSDALIIDPWNEIELNKPRDMSETEYTGICLRRLRKFARKYQICVFVVAHPKKIRRDKNDKTFLIPTLYDISGSAHWYNKADNGMIVYRDFENDCVDVYVKKVKFKTYGKQGIVNFKYLRGSGNYIESKEQGGW